MVLPRQAVRSTQLPTDCGEPTRTVARCGRTSSPPSAAPTSAPPAVPWPPCLPQARATASRSCCSPPCRPTSTDRRLLAKRLGAPLLFGRLWEKTGCKAVIDGLLAGRLFEFPVERAVFATVLHRLMVSGSDRACEKWLADYDIPGVDGLALHHLYRAMAWLGEELPPEQQAGATPFAPAHGQGSGRGATVCPPAGTSSASSRWCSWTPPP